MKVRFYILSNKFHGKFHCLSSLLFVYFLLFFFFMFLYFFMLFYMNAIFHCKKHFAYVLVCVFVCMCYVCICRDTTFKKHKINIQPIQSQSVKNFILFRVLFFLLFELHFLEMCFCCLMFIVVGGVFSFSFSTSAA